MRIYKLEKIASSLPGSLLIPGISGLAHLALFQAGDTWEEAGETRGIRLRVKCVPKVEEEKYLKFVCFSSSIFVYRAYKKNLVEFFFCKS